MPIDQSSHLQLERGFNDIDWASLRQRSFSPSPAACEDEALYFLLLDRFSDGGENDYRDNQGSTVTAGATPRINFAADAARAGSVTINAGIYAAAATLTCFYSTDAAQIGGSVAVEPRNGRAAWIAVPPGGFVVHGQVRG